MPPVVENTRGVKFPCSSLISLSLFALLFSFSWLTYKVSCPEIVADDVETHFVVRSTQYAVPGWRISPLRAANEAQCQLLGKQNPGYPARRNSATKQNPARQNRILRDKTSGFTNHGELHLGGLATNAIGRQKR